MEPTDNNSYLNWNPESSLGFNAPDSCCIPLEDLLDDSAQKGCGMCVHHENPAKCKQDVNARTGRVLANNPELPNKIWMNSCVYILVGRVKREVQPYLWYYALVGTGLALEAIIITALASAYITAINRFSKDDSLTYLFFLSRRIRREEKKYGNGREEEEEEREEEEMEM